ncbi:MAG: YjbH domain-containing protein [Chlamydiales bacterium]|nr:YjbH domain-containing protein [Chlamydiales bacterium]
MSRHLYSGLFLSALVAPFNAEALQEGSSLFHDLEIVERLNRNIHDDLPLIYNNSLVGGYLSMPSARMAKAGTAALGAAYVPPYNNYAINFQVFDHIEISGNYRVFKGMEDKLFGKMGFGDEAERIGNFKIALLLPEDGFPILPSIAIGAEDFVGTKRFNAKYVVVTKSWYEANFETTLGWGHGRIKGLFGGAAWTPFRQTSLPFLKNLTLIAEYDAINYKKHVHEHPQGRRVSSRINVGIACLAWDTLQLSVSSIRGRDVSASASIRYPLGSSKGLLPKIKDPLSYASPIDMEPIGANRSEQELAQELAYAFADQGLDLFTVYLMYTPDKKKLLWLKVVNNRYREESIVRDRVEHLLAALTPSDIEKVVVVVEADALPCQSYSYRREDLVRYHQGIIGKFELETLAPMREAPRAPDEYDAALIFQRRKHIWAFTFRPRLLTFFGSSQGKFKYALGLVASPDGYIFDQLYYKFLFSYNIKSSIANLHHQDILNPSHLINVRTDSIRYFQTNTVAMEKAFLQKAWNLGSGWFYRVAGGYFEAAYGGLSTEFLYYPVKSRFAIGFEAATVMKRHYKGVTFTRKIRKLNKHNQVTYVPFVGTQYFANLFYDYKPLNLELQVTAGQFLAKDLGVRTEVTRYYRSGLRFSLWYTYTSAKDIVNGKKYHDKGFAFTIPFDMFLRQSSRNYIGYGMSVWLRDQGAQAETGKTLFSTIQDERYNYDDK